MSTDSADTILDQATLARLRQLEAFKPGIIARLVDSFVGNQSRFIEEAPGLAAAGDFENLRIRVHALKGAAASLGALPLAAIAQDIEHAAREQPAMVPGSLPALGSEFERACAALSAWAGKPDGN
jgi:HPt (histidine-containing phosphotransfer) domain-containing protein